MTKPTTERSIWLIDVNKIIRNPDNPNYHTERDISVMAKTIEQGGLDEPISVSPIAGTDMYLINFGEARWEATKNLGLKTIEAMVEELTPLERARKIATENVSRSHNSLTQCLSFALLYKNGDTTQIIADTYEKTVQSVAQQIAIGQFPATLIAKLRSNPVWKLGYMKALLALRLDEQGRFLKTGGGRSVLETPERINYAEIEHAIDLVNENQIDTRDKLLLYVAKRRAQISKQLRDTEITEELQAREAEIRQQAAEQIQKQVTLAVSQITETHTQELTQLQSRLQGAITQAQQARLEKATLEAQQSQASTEVSNLTVEYQRQFAQKNSEIAAKDAQVQELLGHIEHLKAQASSTSHEQQAIRTQELMQQIRTQLDAEYGRQLDAIKEHYAQRERQLEIQAAAKVENIINKIRTHSGQLADALTMAETTYQLFTQEQWDDLGYEVQQLMSTLQAAQNRLAQLRHATISISAD